MKLTARSALVVVGALVAAAAGTVPATAAPSYDLNPAGNGQSVQPFTCDGLGDLMIRTNNNHSSDSGGWSSAKIVSGGTGTLIPVSFTFSAYDVTKGAQLFSFTQPKGDGNANHQQTTYHCYQTMTGTLADLLEPGDEVPPGADLSDTVTATFSAEAVHVG
ncbi:hypothetical protein GCM10009841_35060 [Microlunatus panaciterrae]|uniref:Secreted protein n=1 Tax=Microlunatus panaciterrae TaxID=400768 RepID=A0ABS2RGN7_9ACTN|nr:hypothetical protein [Microlunatus panaciterrae]MBM7798163.1 hypothetical protein [Microlunatus panaciterrae]